MDPDKVREDITGAVGVPNENENRRRVLGFFAKRMFVEVICISSLRVHI